MFDLSIYEKNLESALSAARKQNIILPTFEQMKNPEFISEAITEKLRSAGLWDLDPINLFRISWKNEPVESGGLFGGVNYLELPKQLTGVDARILCLVGKWFPTGAHKVGATYGCLVPSLVTGQFNPEEDKAVWPSTGNFCRGGAYNSALLACDSIAILPEEMSAERFEWLSGIAGEVIRTPGCESNVKEIFDKCWELRKTRDDIVIFNQFEEPGNYLWHYEVTGSAVEELFDSVMTDGNRLAGFISSSGSAGTLAAGDYLKQQFPYCKIAAAEALQCPTLLNNGFGGHRIEGIGDKHVPWIHNVRNTDMVIAVDDESCMRLVRLFNEPEGHEYLASAGINESLAGSLDLLGISGIGNVLAAVKFAKYFELSSEDVVITVLTDSMELYGSRLNELEEEHGKYAQAEAMKDHHVHLLGAGTDNLLELTHPEKKRIHNLKYYTWIEQQQKNLDKLNAQWYDFPHYWEAIQSAAPEIDELITEFNGKVGLV